MTLDFPIIPMVNAGSLSEIGMGIAAQGWQSLLHNTVRWDKRPLQPMIREWADRFQCLHLHNPWGVYEPMKCDAYSASLKRAVRLPVNQLAPNTIDQVSKRLNVVEFVAAAKAFPHRLSVYVGSPLNLLRIAGESQASWLMRFLSVMDPFIEGHVAEIGFDNFMGSRPSYPSNLKGPNGLPADAFKAIKSLGIDVAIEPFNYVIDAWLHATTKWLTQSMLADMKARRWVPRNVDEGLEIQVPGSKGERWVIIAAMPNGATSQQKIDHLTKLQDDNPTATIAAYALELPTELLS